MPSQAASVAQGPPTSTLSTDCVVFFEPDLFSSGQSEGRIRPPSRPPANTFRLTGSNADSCTSDVPGQAPVTAMPAPTSAPPRTLPSKGKCPRFRETRIGSGAWPVERAILNTNLRDRELGVKWRVGSHRVGSYALAPLATMKVLSMCMLVHWSCSMITFGAKTPAAYRAEPKAVPHA